MKSWKMAFLMTFGQKLAIFHNHLNTVKKMTEMKKWPIFDQMSSGRPFFHFSFTKKFQKCWNFSKNVNFFFQFSYWTPDLQNFFRLWLIAAKPDFAAYLSFWWGCKTSRLTCRKWKIKKKSMRKNLRKHWKFSELNQVY